MEPKNKGEDKVLVSGMVSSPIVHRDASGRCTIDWQTPDGEMPYRASVLMAVELVAECVERINEAVDLREEIASLRSEGLSNTHGPAGEAQSISAAVAGGEDGALASRPAGDSLRANDAPSLRDRGSIGCDSCGARGEDHHEWTCKYNPAAL